MNRFVIQAVLSLTLLIAAGSVSANQDTFRAAVVVNDEVISMLDLTMRTRLAILATGQTQSAELHRRMLPQVMRGLIDERLQSQEAARLDITASDENVAKTVGDLARRNNMSREDLLRELARRGVMPSVLQQQVRAQILWQTLVARRLRPSVRIGQEEIEEVVKRIIKNRGAMQRNVAEIFLAVDTALDDAEVRANADRLIQQLQAGAKFSGLARQFSESATASRGGDLGWVQEGQLPEELDRVLSRMQSGQASSPIRTLNGYHILLLRDQRQNSMGEVIVQLKQVLFGLAADASEDDVKKVEALAAAARERIDGCARVDELAEELGAPGSGDLGTLKLSDLPSPIRDAVQTLPIGRGSQPLQVAGGLSVLVVCAREDSSVDRKRIEERLTNERLDVLSRRYMRDLRRSANVDIRI
jgi:peptidyl-prolyl cis-trans isomerase SurA